MHIADAKPPPDNVMLASDAFLYALFSGHLSALYELSM
jgi:hypothetical protein